MNKEFLERLKNVDLQQLVESSDLTYYELRKLLEILIRINKDPVTLRVLSSILQSLNMMEIRNVKVPTVKRISKKSKKVF
jgi:hypothetical protein